MRTGRARREALSRARLACKEARSCIKLYRGAAVPAYRAQGTYEWLTGHKRAALKWWRRSLRVGERLGFDYQLAVTHLEMGERLWRPRPSRGSREAFLRDGRRV